jgi:hypothetical protein
MNPGFLSAGYGGLSFTRITIAAVGFLSIFLAGCQLIGGGSTDPMEELRDRIRSTVSDTARSGAMLDSVDNIDRLLIESATFMRDAALRERNLFLDYDSTRADYEAFFADARLGRLNLQRQLLAAHLEFKSHATSGEWKTLSAAQAHAVSTRIGDLLGQALENE